MSRELPAILSQHFVERYFDLILLPSSHRGFHDDWLAGIKNLMSSHDGLYYSVLACSASHIHLLNNSTPAQSFSLQYYSSATKALSVQLTGPADPEDDNGLLMTVVLLYLHGCMGLGTYSDIPIHVNAAMRIVRSRFLEGSGTIQYLFDRIAVESVLYQIFLMSTGLWTQAPEADFTFDDHFWGQAEDILDRCHLFPGNDTATLNSPVLGLPPALFRLSFLLRSQFGCGLFPDPAVVNQVRSEVEDWELALLLLDEPFPSFVEHNSAPQAAYEAEAQQVHRDAKCLYALIASLLLGQLDRDNDPGSGPPLPESPEAWQVAKAVRILKRHKRTVGWTKCFIGNWPVYTIGFFMTASQDQELVRDDLQRRCDAMGSAQVARFKQDLEKVWAQRRGDSI
ncbi:hypothetical protein Micbo1qcDRAFT_125212 [Microdochium bolleyi]|uniref:Fungal-specific transcription factor domain-domain-containing protein n=1 Tax=Microdochium bolleyi TaxID=196109 RepID=A0A136IQH3_9PEZI|nr:hypothetical protein Micbo1qcDRAFT_125212 [Microdochium bolleyi]